MSRFRIFAAEREAYRFCAAIDTLLGYPRTHTRDAVEHLRIGPRLPPPAPSPPPLRPQHAPDSVPVASATDPPRAPPAALYDCVRAQYCKEIFGNLVNRRAGAGSGPYAALLTLPAIEHAHAQL